jgi:hypothetical protein
MYEDGEAVEHIVGALNELPGPRVNGAEIVAWVGMLGLRRGPRFFERMNAATSVRLTEALSPPPARPAPAPAPRRPDTAPLPAFRLPSSTSAPTATRRFVNDTPPETVIPQVMSAPDTHVVDWPYALQWAREKGVRIPDGSSRATTRLLINDERLKRRLPQWTIVEAKKTGPVPPPALTVVSGAENAT